MNRWLSPNVSLQGRHSIQRRSYIVVRCSFNFSQKATQIAIRWLLPLRCGRCRRKSWFVAFRHALTWSTPWSTWSLGLRTIPVVFLIIPLEQCLLLLLVHESRRFTTTGGWVVAEVHASAVPQNAKCATNFSLFDFEWCWEETGRRLIRKYAFQRSFVDSILGSIYVALCNKNGEQYQKAPSLEYNSALSCS